MTEVFINGDFENKFNRLSTKMQKDVEKILNNLQEDKLSLRRLSHSKLYITYLSGHVLIFSKNNTTILAMDIMTRDEFNRELKESSRFIF